ncbi:MAG: c-type cytochrome [Nitrospirae bacterium]|nr:c-type cytochrome [Nitrospirota bacterium]
MDNAKRLYIIAGAALVFIFIVIKFFDSPPGDVIFRREGCIDCHSFKGQGGSAGPELTAVTKRRDDAWIRQQIKDPQVHNPGSLMPSFKHLSGKEVSALLKYLKS